MQVLALEGAVKQILLVELRCLGDPVKLHCQGCQLLVDRRAVDRLVRIVRTLPSQLVHTLQDGVCLVECTLCRLDQGHAVLCVR